MALWYFIKVMGQLVFHRHTDYKKLSNFICSCFLSNLWSQKLNNFYHRLTSFCTYQYYWYGPIILCVVVIVRRRRHIIYLFCDHIAQLWTTRWIIHTVLQLHYYSSFNTCLFTIHVYLFIEQLGNYTTDKPLKHDY